MEMVKLESSPPWATKVEEGNVSAIEVVAKKAARKMLVCNQEFGRGVSLRGLLTSQEQK